MYKPFDQINVANSWIKYGIAYQQMSVAAARPLPHRIERARRDLRRVWMIFHENREVTEFMTGYEPYWSVLLAAENSLESLTRDEVPELAPVVELVRSVGRLMSTPGEMEGDRSRIVATLEEAIRVANQIPPVV